MNIIEDIKKQHDDFIKQIEKQIGQKIPSLTISESQNNSLEEAQKQLESAISAKEKAIKRWDEEIQRHERMIARLNKQIEAEKKIIKEVEKAEASAKPTPVAPKATARKKADTTKSTSKTKGKKS